MKLFRINPFFVLLLGGALVLGLPASGKTQELVKGESFLASASSYSIPENEVWKIMGDFGGGMPATAQPLDSLALVRKYSGKGMNLTDIHPQNLKGGMVMRETLPMWLAPGSKFSLDPNDLLSLYLEKYKILPAPPISLPKLEKD